jgi:hypothetical protein
MQIHARAFFSILLTVICASAALPARSDEVCRDFKWDVTKERALFAGTPASVASSLDLKSAPSIEPSRFYELQLWPQAQVSFAVTPGKQAPARTFAGIAIVRISQPGSYRVALDAPFWIDVASNGVLLPAQDFQGQHDCPAPHKVVVFDLVGPPPFVLQLSGAASQSVRLTITPAPPRKL